MLSTFVPHHTSTDLFVLSPLSSRRDQSRHKLVEKRLKCGYAGTHNADIDLDRRPHEAERCIPVEIGVRSRAADICAVLTQLIRCGLLKVGDPDDADDSSKYPKAEGDNENELLSSSSVEVTENGHRKQ